MQPPRAWATTKTSAHRTAIYTVSEYIFETVEMNGLRLVEIVGGEER